MKITVEANVDAPIDAVWRAFNDPDDILRWDASDDWRVTRASNDLRVSGLLELRVDPRDEGAGFDFAATYTRIEPERLIEWRMDDGRHVRVEFAGTSAGVTIRQTFDAQATTSMDEQRLDWQSVLDSFARYVATMQERRCRHEA